MTTARCRLAARQTRRLLVASLVLVLAALPGCSSSKGKYAGKLKVEASPKLQELGVTVKEWRFSESDKTFGVQLSATKDFGPPNKIELSIEGKGRFSSPVPVKLKAGEKAVLTLRAGEGARSGSLGVRIAQTPVTPAKLVELINRDHRRVGKGA